MVNLFFQAILSKLAIKQRLKLTLLNGTLVALRQKSIIRLDKYNFPAKKSFSDKTNKSSETTVNQPKTVLAYTLTLIDGGLRTITGQIGKLEPDSYQLVTHCSNTGGAGAEFVAFSDAFFVIKGQVSVTNKGASCLLCFVEDNQPWSKVPPRYHAWYKACRQRSLSMRNFRMTDEKGKLIKMEGFAPPENAACEEKQPVKKEQPVKKKLTSKAISKAPAKSKKELVN